jgi:hypothetical protein
MSAKQANKQPLPADVRYRHAALLELAAARLESGEAPTAAERSAAASALRLRAAALRAGNV